VDKGVVRRHAKKANVQSADFTGWPFPRKPASLVARNCVRRSRSFKGQDDGQAAEGSLDPLEEPAEVGRRAIERHGVEQFEAAGEGVLEGVGRPRSKLLMRGFPPVTPHFPREVLGGVELVFDERLEDGKPRLVVRDLDLLPGGNLDLHRLESALGFVDADGYGVLQQEVLRVLGEDDIEVAGERQI
jgi:hypothetical protein